MRYGGIKNIGFPKIKINKNTIETQLCSSDDVCTKFSYLKTILLNINQDECQNSILVPNVEFVFKICIKIIPVSSHIKILKSYLIAIGDYSGGSMGWDMKLQYIWTI